MSDQDSRLNVLGHWVCEVCGRSGPDPLKLTHLKLGNEGQRCHGPVVRVEYVPRSDHRRAVGALKEIEAYFVGGWPDPEDLPRIRKLARSGLGKEPWPGREQHPSETPEQRHYRELHDGTLTVIPPGGDPREQAA